MFKKYLPGRLKRWLTVQKVKHHTFICECGKFFDGKFFIYFLRHQRTANHIGFKKMETKLAITPFDKKIREMRNDLLKIKVIDSKSDKIKNLKNELYVLIKKREKWVKDNF